MFYFDVLRKHILRKYRFSIHEDVLNVIYLTIRHKIIKHVEFISLTVFSLIYVWKWVERKSLLPYSMLLENNVYLKTSYALESSFVTLF
jgi:hypothetical protein